MREQLRAMALAPAAYTAPFMLTPHVRREMEAVLMPRLLAARQAPQPVTSARNVAVPALDEAQIREFVALVLAEDDDAILRYAADLQSRGVSVESIYLDLLAPAARALGDMWCEDTCDFVEVTIAVSRLQLVLRDLSQMFVRDRTDAALVGSVLLACTPGEQHSLGLFMVAEFFIRDGWGVRVGPPLSEDRLLADVRTSWYDVVGFSAACDTRLDHLKREISRVRKASKNPRVLVMAGGRCFNEQPELLSRVGADASAANAELAPEIARQLLALS